MSRITIEVDDPVIANSIAVWFESEDAIKSWYESQGNIVERLRQENPKINYVDWTEVEFGEPNRWGDVEHEVIIHLEEE